MNKLSVMLTTTLTVGILSACANPGKITGGGSVIGDGGKKIANLGFNGDTCDGDLNNPKGHFNYIDQNNNVKMNGDLFAYGMCVSPDQWQGLWLALDCEFVCQAFFPPPTHLIYANYRSTHPKNPGEGQMLVCVKDNGEGSKASGADEIFVQVYSGPFAGYQQLGSIQGNIQNHTCDDE